MRIFLQTKNTKEEREKEDNYDWTYIDGDENTANQRQRTETNTRMEEQDVERVIEKPFEPGSTGKTDKEVYEANPELQKNILPLPPLENTLKTGEIAKQPLKQ